MLACYGIPNSFTELLKYMNSQNSVRYGVLIAVSRRVPNIGPLVEGCSITGGIDGFVAVLHTAILTGWLDFSGGGFLPVLE
jgi:hypothetical protein